MRWGRSCQGLGVGREPSHAIYRVHVGVRWEVGSGRWEVWTFRCSRRRNDVEIVSLQVRW